MAVSVMVPVQVKLPDGEAIWVRLSDADEPQDVGLGDAVEVMAAVGFDETIRTVAGNVHAALRSLRPDEVSVQFGVELTVKSGKLISVLTDAGDSATLALTVTWRSEDAGSTGGGGEST